MNQYCFSINSEEEINSTMQVTVKTFLTKLYKKPGLEGHFDKDEKLPFIIIFSKKDNQVCIKLTSRAKKNVEKIEKIHSQLKAKDLNVGNGIKLEKPFLYQLEQCNWWEKGCLPGESKKWETLEHNGPYFTHLMEPYVPHKAPLLYDGKKYVLTPEEERIANFYARRIISEQGGTITIFLTKDKTFNDNFWKDFKTYLTPEHKALFKDFGKVDFKLIVKKLKEMKETDKNISEKEKEAKKVKVAEKKADYGFAVINGIKEPVSNFVIEPAALFLGRGQNPNRGKIKRDIEPEEVTINVGKEAPIPEPPEGHKWKEVIHDSTLSWIANWRDPISNELKYVYLSAEGQLKGKSDFIKYEKARKLNKFINVVRNKYEKDIEGKNAKLQQLGTVLYLIDVYGLRVGNEKDESETDTVGASTLRVEHVKLEKPDIIFDFLGKDSIQYYKKLPVPENVYKNFEKFLKNKKPTDPVFDLISAADINDYLKTFDKDFSAKAFRTRLASTIMDAALKKIKVKKTATQDEKKKLFDKANIEVAEVLNHRRTVPPKAKDTIKKYQDELKELNKELKNAKSEEASDKKIQTIKNKIQKKKDQIESKQDTLNIAISTSRTNYIDPRINVAWSKKHDLNLNKIYSAVLQRKFKWAIDMTDKDWDYIETEIMKGMEKLNPSTGEKPAAKPTKQASKPAPKSISKKPPAKVPIPPLSKKGIEIFKYTEKSIGIIGDTKSVSQELKQLGGKWIPLTIQEKKVFGWMFSLKKKDQVEKVLNENGIEYTDLVESKNVKEPEIEYIPEAPEILAPSQEEQSAEESHESESEKSTPAEDKVEVLDYKPTSLLIVNLPNDKKKHVKTLGGISRDITFNDKKINGWIVSKKKWKLLEELLGIEIDLEDLPEEGDNLLSSDLLNFYSGDMDIMGYNINDIFKWSDEKLAKNDDYINLLFPTFPDASDAPVFLDKESVKLLKFDEKYRVQVITAALLMMDYYGYKLITSDSEDFEIKRVKPIEETTLLKSPKEYKRIERILKFLRIVDQRSLYFLFFLGLCRDLKDDLEFRKMVNKHYSFLSWMMAIGVNNNIVGNFNVLTMSFKH